MKNGVILHVKIGFFCWFCDEPRPIGLVIGFAGVVPCVCVCIYKVCPVTTAKTHSSSLHGGSGEIAKKHVNTARSGHRTTDNREYR